jgi:DNA repair exonuclease SbcCD ATPase subunit
MGPKERPSSTKESHMANWAADRVLSVLERLPDPIGSLISAFPGSYEAANDSGWIDNWFLELTTAIAEGRTPELPTLSATSAPVAVIDALAKRASEHELRLLSLTPHFFRGFRGGTTSIDIKESLVVVEGLNSSGKTSVSEALEWLFTGGLSRRSMGNPKELANCIANAFRPDGETTWVELRARLDSTPMVLRRVLTHDYTDAKESQATSRLFRDGRELTIDEEAELFESLFAGVHPILMQHTIRDFIYSTPADRRRYFERLLQIDELTSLIEKAVLGDPRLREFPAPRAPDGRKYLDGFKSVVSSGGAIKELKRLEKPASGRLAEIDKSLLQIAVEEFTIARKDIGSLEREVARLQELERTRKFPGIQYLRITATGETPDSNILLPAAKRLADAQKRALDAQRAVGQLSDADKVVAGAVQELARLGVLTLRPSGDQLCPVCLDDRRTLTKSRVGPLLEFGPIADALRVANAAVGQEEANWAAAKQSFLAAANRWVFETDRVSVDRIVLSADIFKLAQAAVVSADAVNARVSTLVSLVQAATPSEIVTAAFRSSIEKALTQLREHIGQHSRTVVELERGLGSGATTDPLYAAREYFLELIRHRADAALQIQWEGALRNAQSVLKTIREALIETRTAIIEGSRIEFTKAMKEVWDLLRSDSSGHFSHIEIPTPRGKGYKLELEVKAILNDGTADSEVDALRVFSESQINVIGIAAYVTRATALGHQVLVLDDPVQSMDEEHFKSLAGRLIPELLKQGRQIIVLTHSEAFARELSYAHFQSLEYATLSTRYSRRRGCCVDEGNRRVAERLRAAEKLLDDGKLEPGWLKVRLALERLYPLAVKASDPSFDPEQWRSLTAESMWDSGAGAAIMARVPDSGPTLRDILSRSAKGAHDATAKSRTELKEAITYIRKLLTPLRIGSG